MADVEGVPNPPRREELLDSQEDITEVEPEKVVNQNIPSEGQDTTKEKKLCDKQSLSGNEKEEVKKREEAKVKEVGGEPRAKESIENDRKVEHSLSGNEKEEVKSGEEAKEEKTGGVSLCSFFYSETCIRRTPCIKRTVQHSPRVFA